MRNPFKRSPNPYVVERDRLLIRMKQLLPESDEYQKVMTRLNEIDCILNRTSELKKTVIPALGTIGAVGMLYATQQAIGLVPRAVDAIVAKGQQKQTKDQY